MKKITTKCIKSRLEELINISGGRPAHLSDLSVEDAMDYLRVFIIYNQFDIEALKRELRNASR